MFQTKFDGLICQSYSPHCSYFTNRMSSAEVGKEFCSVLKEKSQRFIADCCFQQTKYGKEERQHIDVYYPKNKNPENSIVVFFHGGYWQEGSAAEYAFVAKPFVEAGYTFIIPNRILYPEVRIGDINKQDMQAMSCIATSFPNTKDITLTGHSSGGCECITMVQTNWSELGYTHVENYLRNKLARICVACGVFEVTHLLGTAVDKPLSMTWTEALNLSPIAHTEELKQNLKNYSHCKLCFLSVEHESPTILKWTKIFLKELEHFEIPFRSELLKGMDHFNIVTTIDETNSIFAKMIMDKEADEIECGTCTQRIDVDLFFQSC